ncbi:MAG TPA: PA0069 family radical SAM protein [Hyphomicrobiaceae bacterium]|nr:PA0069 family radical SAM protein [Hyphomicrobiaceae bacterium]
MKDATEPNEETATARVAVDLRRGRGALSNASGRFERTARESFDDGWGSLEGLAAFKTEVAIEQAKSIISTNDSPDISFDQSINPYRGCEHGCSYCYARPTHAYLGHSPGLDFETRLYAKVNAAEVLERELARPGYLCKTIALGAVTDVYQPIERERRITRSVLEVLSRTNHPVGIVTKSALVLRDIDILAPMAAKGLAKVAISLTTLDRDVARRMEPRAATPGRRVDTIRSLAAAGIPVTVMMAPIVPAINDSEIEAILAEARGAGATDAGYVLLRLPLELKELFREWLSEAFPDRAARVISVLRSMHGGRDYVSAFGTRQRGTGPFAEQIGTRFRLASRRLGLDERSLKLRTDLFERPLSERHGQLRLL